MKNLTLLVWLTQLGLGVAMPLAGFVLIGVWLHEVIGWGVWTVFVGIALGLYCAFQGLMTSLKTMKQLSDTKDKQENVAFNDHD